MRDALILGSICAYVAAMVAIGFWAARKIKNNHDFMLAGQRLGRLVLMGTLLATWTGAGTIMGRASFSYTYGPLASIFYSIGAPLGILIMYLFLAKRVREHSKYTVPELMQQRYGPSVRIVTAVAIVIAYSAIVSEQVRGLGYILHLTTGFPEGVAKIVGLVVVVFLAFSGGLISVAYTDALSALLITIGLVGAFIFVLVTLGGFGGLAERLPEDHMTWSGGLTPIQMLGYVLPTLLLILGDQNMYQRFSAAQSPEVAKRSTVGFLAGDLLFYGAVIVISSGAAVLLPAIQPDTAVLRLSTDSLPVALGAIMLMAATAFIITTANSYLLSSAGNLVRDIYGSLSKKERGSRRELLLTRMTIVLLGAAAFVIGEFFPGVLEIQVFAYTMYGAVVTPSLLATFLWRRATAVGCIASMITGIVATVGWEFGLDKPFDWNSVLVALPLAVLALVVGSLLTTPRAPAEQSVPA
ncbi:MULTISPECIES: sodium:solute symporter family protein [Prauserella salsuginis group]|uniref:SSS family solute:Na+ symporter n=2 Tax=Prauserella salsuginis group TaxID=2893672 RepID=A0A839XPU3_9PSEU|nr:MULTISPECIES: sodium:solute symporter family protein [Prauserella salsuginis group]MBB3664717.1 SSS family solute:Na+ symporter [Prauserella sediminis]MCR3722183.1 solute:Na+ symporter, SSS family [Prauserella flava]MCR3736181.1 solute:Na+ symporter, SSS family [Prauserella salsuginis]